MAEKDGALASKPYLLLVEDNPDDVDLTLRALRRAHMAEYVFVARDGQEAVDHLFDGDRRRSPPMVVLLDLRLPRLSGLDVLERIRADERLCHLPVVVLTTSVEDGDVRRAYAHHVNGFVRKPVDFGQFAEVVQTLGLYWLRINVPPPG